MKDPNARRRLVVALVGVVVVAALGAHQAWKTLRPRVVTVQGTVGTIDLVNRSAALQIVHPKTGQLIEIPGSVPDNCEITIDGQPATLADVRSGEMVTVNGALSATGKATVNWVRVHRAAAPTSAPTAPPGQS